MYVDVQEIDRADSVGQKIEHPDSNQFSVQAIALMIGAELLSFVICLYYFSIKP